jgi:hypothetical protein
MKLQRWQVLVEYGHGEKKKRNTKKRQRPWEVKLALTQETVLRERLAIVVRPRREIGIRVRVNVPASEQQRE